MFLLSNRICGDWKTGTLDLFTTSPYTKIPILGRALSCGKRGNTSNFYTRTVYSDPVFVGFIAVILPAIYMLVGNPRTFGHPPVLCHIHRLLYGKPYHRSGKRSKWLPFWLLLTRGLSTFVYRFNLNALDFGNITANLVFLLGIGIFTFVLLTAKRRYWRAE